MNTGDRVKFVGKDEVFHGALEGKEGTVLGPAYYQSMDYVLFYQDGDTASAIVPASKLLIL